MVTQHAKGDQLLSWWELKADIGFILSFNWRHAEQLKEAITMFLSARLNHLACQASKMLAECGSHSTKMLLASNPQSPAELLEYLTEISTEDILLRIAENSSTSALTLEKLAYHSSSNVRQAVAENSNTPESCLFQLASDEAADIRYCLAENPRVPFSVLYLLTDDENPYIGARARKTLGQLLSDRREPLRTRIRLCRDDNQLAQEIIAEIQRMNAKSLAGAINECTYPSP